MTKEERAIQSQIRENERMQKQLSESSYKQNARFKALEVAQYLKPSTNYISDRTTLSQNLPKQETDYDIVKKAEEIYQWLIKVLK